MAKDDNVKGSNYGCFIFCIIGTIIAVILSSHSLYWLFLIVIVWSLGIGVLTENNKGSPAKTCVWT